MGKSDNKPGKKYKTVLIVEDQDCGRTEVSLSVLEKLPNGKLKRLSVEQADALSIQSNSGAGQAMYHILDALTKMTNMEEQDNAAG